MFARLYPELSAGFLREGQDRAGVLWYLARSFDASGSGSVNLGALADWLAPVLSRRAIQRRLREGEGVLWTRRKRGGANWRETRIVLCGLESVCRHFDVLPRSAPVLCEVDKLKGWARSRGALLASWLASRNGRPTSTATIEQVTGIKRGAAWRYLREIPKRRNVAASLQDAAGKVYASHFEGGSGAWTRRDAKGVLWYFWTLPTSHAVDFQTGSRSRCRKVVSNLRSCNEAQDWRRVYYLDAMKARKDKRRGSPYLVFEGVRHGVGLWAACA